MNIWSVILSPDFLFTSIRVMTPILFAAMACMVFVKGGIDPIGTEGIMLSCALAGPVGGYFTHSALGGVIFAMACLLYTSGAADEEDSGGFGGPRNL